MQSRTRCEYQNVLVPNGPSGYGVHYAFSPTKTINVKCEESITWDGNGKQISHYCTAYKSNVYTGKASMTVPVTYCDYKWKPTSSSPSIVTDILVNNRYSYYPCVTPRFEKVIGPSDDEIADRINSAAISLSSLPIQSMMNLPLAILELRDIPKTLRQLPRLFRFLKSPVATARRLGLWSTVSEVASNYLAYVFGVKPTVGDVNNFLGQVPKRVKVGVRQVRYKRGQKVRCGFTIRGEELNDYYSATTSSSGWWGYPQGSPGAWSTGNPFYSWGANSTGIANKGTERTKAWPWLADYYVTSREVTGVVYGRVAVDYAHDFDRMDDISINGDPLSVGWELVPFSFVVDWFADLGKWLREANRLTAARQTGFSLDGGIWCSKRVSQVHYAPILTQAWSDDGGKYDPSIQYPVKFTVATTKTVFMRELYRDVSYGRSVLTDRVVLPRLNLKGLSNQGAFQWATGTALAIQQMGF